MIEDKTEPCSECGVHCHPGHLFEISDQDGKRKVCPVCMTTKFPEEFNKLCGVATNAGMVSGALRYFEKSVEEALSELFSYDIMSDQINEYFGKDNLIGKLACQRLHVINEHAKRNPT